MTLKKILAASLLPFPFAVLLLMIGLALLWFTQRQRLERVAVSLGLLVAPARHDRRCGGVLASLHLDWWLIGNAHIMRGLRKEQTQTTRGDDP